MAVGKSLKWSHYAKKTTKKFQKMYFKYIFWFYNPWEKKEDSEVLQTVKNRFPIIFLSVILTK